MTTAESQRIGLSDTEFDDLARRVSAAFKADSRDEALRLQAELCVTGLVPHADVRIRQIAHFASVERADVQGEAFARVLTALQLGRTVQQAMLWSFYKGAAADLCNWATKHEGHAHRQHLGQQDHALEDIIVRAMSGERREIRDAASLDPTAIARVVADDTHATSAAFTVMRDVVAAELAMMKPPAMRDVWLCMCRGHFDGPDIAKQLGITQTLVRQCKTHLRNFLLGDGRALISNLDPEVQ